MTLSRVTKAVVVPAVNLNEHQTVMQLALVNPDGSPASTVKKQPAQADSTATDVTGLVADFNALLAKLRTAGILS